MQHNKTSVQHGIRIVAGAVFAGVLSFPLLSYAQLSSSNYQVVVFGVGSAGAGVGTSTNYTAESNVGPDFEYDTPVVQTSGGGGGGSSSNNDENEDGAGSGDVVLETEDSEPLSLVEEEGVVDSELSDDTSLEDADTKEDSPFETEEADLILEERSVTYVDNGYYITVTEHFDDGSIVTMGVHSGAILDENGNQVTKDKKLKIILRVRLLATEQVPVKSLKSDLQGGKLFELLVVDQYGTKYTTFDPELDVSITLPPETMEAEEVRLYFYEIETESWVQVTEAEFLGNEVSFSVGHLTTFGVWGVKDTPVILDTETSVASGVEGDSGCDNLFVCYWWLFVIMVLIILGGWKHSRRSE